MDVVQGLEEGQAGSTLTMNIEPGADWSSTNTVNAFILFTALKKTTYFSLTF